MGMSIPDPEGFAKTIEACENLDALCALSKETITRSLLKKARLLTRPTLARRDAPWPKQGRSE